MRISSGISVSLPCQDENAAIQVLAFLQTSPALDALDAFRFASQGELEVRKRAAVMVRKFKHPEFLPFIEGWRKVEPDEDVRKLLGAAIHAFDEKPSWSAAQATGPPDADPASDHPKAWAARE